MNYVINCPSCNTSVKLESEEPIEVIACPCCGGDVSEDFEEVSEDEE